jgi:catalase
VTNDKLEALEPFREDGTDEVLTTNHGTRINDNQNSLKAGARGPSLREDFILRGRSPTSTTSAFPSRSSTRGGPPPTDTSRCTSR